MAGRFTRMLLSEDWSRFPLGRLRRDNTARGEYMASIAPLNPNGWYHSSSVPGWPDRQRSPLTIVRTRGGRRLELRDSISPWGPALVLTRGEEPWRDLEVAVEVEVRDFRAVGVVVRYRTVRDFYAAVLESGVWKLVRMLEGAVTVLASAPWTPGRGPVRMMLRAEADRLTARAGKLTLAARDGCIASGGVGLWINGRSAFGPLAVRTTGREAARIARGQAATAARVGAKRKGLPSMELLAEIDVRGHAIGRQIRFADLDGDGRKELLFAAPTWHGGRQWRYAKLARLSAMNLDGRVLWERGRIEKDSSDVTCDLPFQAANRGTGMEVVACFGWKLEVLDPRSGRTVRCAVTPRPPKMEPYWDEISSYWGDGHGDDLPHLIPDSILLCNLTGRGPWGDLILKDRYHSAWALDGRTLKVLWHHRCNTGHYPYACDLNGDGRDEVLLGYSRLDSLGRLIGRLVRGDHPDACFSYVDCHGRRHNMHPCGEAGFLDELPGGRLTEVHLGHVQHLSVARFVPDLPDLERIIVTYHGNEGIIVLMDMDDRVIRKAERYGAGAVCQPVNWTGDGRELIAFSARRGDGGLWDEHFDLVVPFPNDDRPAKCMEVQDVFGLGWDQIVVWDEQRLHVYGPKDHPRLRPRRYAPIRPGPNLSNYQVNYSLPAWA